MRKENTERRLMSATRCGWAALCLEPNRVLGFGVGAHCLESRILCRIHISQKVLNTVPGDQQLETE